MPTILTVDDSPSDLGLIAAHLGTARPEWNVVTVETGSEALAKVNESAFDVVITDLRMPVMDGLELVGKLKQDHPHLPAIILTAHGSEHLAVEALAAGAASYVPKSLLSDCLVDTIEQVLDRVRLGHNYRRLIESVDQIDHRYTLENDPALIPPLVDLVQEMAYGVQLVDASERHQLGIALEEALINAMYHGNLELPTPDLPNVRRQLRSGETVPAIEQRRAEEDYRNRRVRVAATIRPDEARIVIRDDGFGFHPNSIPGPDEQNILERAGRGLVLMSKFMDELTFSEIGNEVVMVKKRSGTGAQ